MKSRYVLLFLLLFVFELTPLICGAQNQKFIAGIRSPGISIGGGSDTATVLFAVARMDTTYRPVGLNVYLPPAHCMDAEFENVVTLYDWVADSIGTLVLTNNLSDTIRVDSVSVTSYPAGSVTLFEMNYPLAIAGRDSGLINFSYRRPSHSTVEAPFTISISGRDSEGVVCPSITSTLRYATVRYIPDYGDVLLFPAKAPSSIDINAYGKEAGVPATVLVHFVNNGSIPLRISSYAISGLNDLEFRIARWDYSSDTVVEPGGFIPAYIEWTPHTSFAIASLTLYADDSTSIEPIELAGYFLRSVAESPVARLRMFPNPASRELHLEVEGMTGRVIDCSLIDMLGRSVYEHRTSDHVFSVDITPLPADKYILRVDDGRAVISRMVEVSK